MPLHLRSYTTWLESTLSKTDTFGTGTKCPSYRGVRCLWVINIKFRVGLLDGNLDSRLVDMHQRQTGWKAMLPGLLTYTRTTNWLESYASRPSYLHQNDKLVGKLCFPAFLFTPTTNWLESYASRPSYLHQNDKLVGKLCFPAFLLTPTTNWLESYASRPSYLHQNDKLVGKLCFPAFLLTPERQTGWKAMLPGLLTYTNDKLVGKLCFPAFLRTPERQTGWKAMLPGLLTYTRTTNWLESYASRPSYLHQNDKLVGKLCFPAFLLTPTTNWLESYAFWSTVMFTLHLVMLIQQSST